MQLMPLHPDRSGGLGFLASFPGIFSGVVFALSFVVVAGEALLAVVATPVPFGDLGKWIAGAVL